MVDQERQQTKLENQALSILISSNIALFKEIFVNDDTLLIRHFENQQQPEIKCCIIFIDGMVNSEILNKNVIQPIVQNMLLKSSDDTIGSLQKQVIISNNIERAFNVDKLTSAIVSGDTVLLLEGSPEGLIISSMGWQNRAINEPEAEKVIRGPREGFTEAIMVNLTLIRRKLETPNLKFKFMSLGIQTHTKVCICYLEGIANQKILDELYSRLNGIDMDGILDSGYVQELIKDSQFSPLDTIGYSERPDIVAAKLLEGRIAVIVDGTPIVLTIPHLFVEYFQANEDYYMNFYFSSVNRLLRILGFILTTTLPAFYLALVSFHQEMIPTPLLLSISSARRGVPLPTIIELLLLLVTFELLREAGSRVPTNIGQTLSIVGALVLGQASVEARIVSAPVVIVVSLSAITNLMLPRITGTAGLLRVVLLILSTFLGLYGLIFGITGFLLHLCELRSFGVPYMLHLTSLEPEDLKDTLIRSPWQYMKLRPKLITENNRIRQSSKGGKT
ncbi:MAG: GerA spore germination protein [Clostridiales bacterium]|jgi:spore germination protein KA|nr:GerA spore germination protein [Clostridiales bacterium]